MPATLLSISVDLEPHSRAATSPASETFAKTVRRLADLLTTEGRAVTWVASDPAGSAAIGWAVAANLGHEAALLARAEWSGYEGERSRFATEFLRRKQQAVQAGVSLTTLAAADGVPREHLELLVRQGITAIRTDRSHAETAARQRTTKSGITPVRYGLWQLASDMRICGGGWLSDLLSGRRICRHIDRRIAAGVATHLTIDAAALAAESNVKFSGLTVVLRHIKRRQREDVLQVGTIAESVARLAAPRLSRSAQSILRAA